VVSPLELFYDLAVVVLVAQAAHHLAGHLTWPGFGEFAVVFSLVWIAWGNGSRTMSCTAAKTPARAARSCCRS
jgi:low temperature requirement protein LtrA